MFVLSSYTLMWKQFLQIYHTKRSRSEFYENFQKSFESFKKVSRKSGCPILLQMGLKSSPRLPSHERIKHFHVYPIGNAPEFIFRSFLVIFRGGGPNMSLFLRNRKS